MRSVHLLPCNLIFLLLLTGVFSPAAAEEPQYVLYKNKDGHGIVVFPSEHMFPDLARFFIESGFQQIETGAAVMRSDAKRENMTYMMPEEIQKKHKIEKFIILQVLQSQDILVGIFDPEWGLTLPFSPFTLDQVKEKIPQTLEIFRGKTTRPPKLTRHNAPRGEATHAFI